MGLAYAPNQPVGKGATSGNLKFFNPRLAGGFGRAGTILKGLEFGARFAQRHYKLFTGVGSVPIGTIIGGMVVGSPDNQFPKTFYPVQPHRGGSGRYKPNYSRGSSSRFRSRKRSRQSCCRKCNQSSSSRNMGSFRYRKRSRFYSN